MVIHGQFMAIRVLSLTYNSHVIAHIIIYGNSWKVHGNSCFIFNI